MDINMLIIVIIFYKYCAMRLRSYLIFMIVMHVVYAESEIYILSFYHSIIITFICS